MSREDYRVCLTCAFWNNANTYLDLSYGYKSVCVNEVSTNYRHAIEEDYFCNDYTSYLSDKSCE
jgi:hypothetical protein